jgi:predicted secreted protein
MSYLGRNLRILKDGVPIAAVRTKSVRHIKEPIDISDGEDHGHRELLDVADTVSIEISIEGVMTPQHYQDVLADFLANDLIDVEVEYPDGTSISTEDGAYIMGIQYTGEHRNAVTFASTLVLSGSWLEPAPTPPTPPSSETHQEIFQLARSRPALRATSPAT